MDQAMYVIEGVGEAGVDTEASPGNGRFYAKLYDGSHDTCGYDSIEEAVEELKHYAGWPHADEWPKAEMTYRIVE